jgi:hypothetical protein
MQDRQHKGCGLTCSGLGRAHEIFPIQDDRYGLLLDGSGFLEATGLHCLEKALVEFEMFE